MKVAILMGSVKDSDKMQGASDVFDEFGVEHEVHVMSAHRTPQRVAEFATNARANGYGAIICGAGKAAHLAGAVAAHSTVPVIGVPVQTRALSGVDSLYSIVQMPKGFPVATMAIGAAGAANAGLMAAGILAVSDPDLAQRLDAWRDALSASIPDEPQDD